MPNPIRYIDRSRIEADWDCPRRRYWNYEYQAPGASHKGVISVGEATALTFGGAMHNALSGVLQKGADPDELATILDAQLQKLSYLPSHEFLEYRNLGLGLFWGFYYAVLPNLLDTYNILSIEGEVELSISSTIKMMCRPDIILKRKSDGTVWYPDFKTTGFKTKNWLDSWRYAVQLQTGCAAVEETLNIPVEGAMIIGLYKGYKDKNHLMRSPFTYAYHHEPSGSWNPEWCRAWTLTPVNVYPGGVKEWVHDRFIENPDLIKEQFPTSEEIPVNREMLANFIEQLEYRERMLEMHLEDIEKSEGQEYKSLHLNMGFPQHFKSCRPVIGSACPFIDICDSPSIAQDPVGSGLYVVREPHHIQEAMQDDE